MSATTWQEKAPATADPGRYYDRQASETMARLESQAHDSAEFKAELLKAFQEDPTRLVATPDSSDSIGGLKKTPAVDVFWDYFDGRKADERRAGLVRMLAFLAEHKSELCVGVLLNHIAQEHGDLHASKVAE